MKRRKDRSTFRRVTNDGPRRDQPHSSPHLLTNWRAGNCVGLGNFQRPCCAERRPEVVGIAQTPARQDGYRNHHSWIRGLARVLASTGSCGSGLRGVRAYDTSETDHSEAAFKRWFAQDSTVRKQIILVTKDAPKIPAQLMGMLDKRLEALGTDYVDLLFIHSFGDYYSLDDAMAMVRSKELKEASEAAKKSGKARLVGTRPIIKTAPS